MAGRANTDRTDAARVLRPVLAVLAACLIAFCGWSAFEYSQGRDPLAFLGGDAFRTVAEDGTAVPSIELSGNEATSGGEDAAEGENGKADSIDGSADSDGAKEEKGSNGASSEAASDAGSNDSADEKGSDGSITGGSDGTGGSGSKAPGTSSPSPSASPSNPSASPSSPSSSGEAASPSRPTRIMVSITVDGTAAGAGASSATLSLAPGSTVYDALASCGIDFSAKQTGYGMYVSSIAGLAEKEHGGMSGWMYSVNGATPNVACSAYGLSGGDSVYWWYANVTE